MKRNPSHRAKPRDQARSHVNFAADDPSYSEMIQERRVVAQGSRWRANIEWFLFVPWPFKAPPPALTEPEPKGHLCKASSLQVTHVLEFVGRFLVAWRLVILWIMILRLWVMFLVSIFCSTRGAACGRQANYKFSMRVRDSGSCCDEFCMLCLAQAVTSRRGNIVLQSSS